MGLQTKTLQESTVINKNQIINLSEFTLQEKHIRILEKGLSFVPSPRFDQFTWIKDLNLFARKLALHEVFVKKDERQAKQLGITAEDFPHLRTLMDLLEENEEPSMEINRKFKNKSNYTPSFSEFSSIDLFVKLVSEEITKLEITPWKKEQNLSRNERTALRELKNEKSIEIKASDKGGNIVIMSKSKYRDMCLQIINDPEGYTLLTFNPTDKYLQELDKLLQKGVTDGHITEELKKSLLPLRPTTPTLYSLPKVHKSLIDPPGRPIIAGNNSLTEKVSQFVDYYLHPLVEEIPSYTRDTQHALQHLEDINIPFNTILASFDVVALYNNIPHDQGIKACRYYLKKKYSDDMTSYIIELLTYILTHNFFLFDGKYYLQKRGTAMGTSCAPNYANLFLALWEETMVFTDKTKKYTVNVSKWFRYIDDIFLLWHSSEDLLKEWLNELNINNIGLTLTLINSKERLQFLDLMIETNKDTLSTKLYRKETSTNSLLNWESFHPVPLKLGIPIGQYLRARRNCSNVNDFKEETNRLREMFRSKGYPNRCLKRAYKKALSSDRKQLLIRKKKIMQEKQIRFIATFDNGWDEIKNICQKYWPILQLDENISKVISKSASFTARRSTNLKDILVHSHFSINESTTHWLTSKPGIRRCGHCKVCPFVDNSEFFKSTITEKRYPIKETITCRTMKVIYLITCVCKKQYVGKTYQQFKKRILEHINTVNNITETPISRLVWANHNGDPKCLTFQAIEAITIGPRRGDFDIILRRKESRWIYVLKTQFPNGLNEEFNYTPFL
uniref:Reverse transcriptase domain-containing protein n=1 Tax=Leptobrachium leishanense TaxID=445787 RepID=A0A8C5WH29_9ANUR